MFDFHAHPGEVTENALVCTASTSHISLLAPFPFPSLGALPGYETDLEVLESWARGGGSVGEAGLDRRYDDIEEQERVFHRVLEIARENRSLLTVHGVGHTERLLSALSAFGLPFIFHGFTGSYESAMRIMDMGGYVSLSPRAEKTKHFCSLLTLPVLLTETDMATGEEEERVLRTWTERLSNLSGRDIEAENAQVCKILFNI